MKRKRFSNRQTIETHQLAALRQLIATLLASNPFYSETLRAAGLDVELADIDTFTKQMPVTTKQQIIEDQQQYPPYGSNLTYPIERYNRFSQTSGTTGSPMRWLDTPQDWQWMLDNWAQVFEAAGLCQEDRVFFAFSFGPFLGFWTAFESATQQGFMCIPGGGMSSIARLHTIIDNRATILCCTPTYAIRLGEIAVDQGIAINQSRIRTIIVAGEIGGSVPAVRGQIERLWAGARVFDHHGMTEVGPVSFENVKHPGVLHLIESAYLAEVIDLETKKHVSWGETGELILTTLGRIGSPLLRYRTGDLVRQSAHNAQTLGRPEMAIDGGILGRTDDMVIVRGVNVYPSAVDQIVRSEEQVIEYRVETCDGAGKIQNSIRMTEMKLIVEPVPQCNDCQGLCNRLEHSLRNAFQLRVPVEVVKPGGLPRFEFKAKRWVRRTTG